MEGEPSLILCLRFCRGTASIRWTQNSTAHRCTMLVSQPRYFPRRLGRRLNLLAGSNRWLALLAFYLITLPYAPSHSLVAGTLLMTPTPLPPALEGGGTNVGKNGGDKCSEAASALMRFQQPQYNNGCWSKLYSEFGEPGIFIYYGCQRNFLEFLKIL